MTRFVDLAQGVFEHFRISRFEHCHSSNRFGLYADLSGPFGLLSEVQRPLGPAIAGLFFHSQGMHSAVAIDGIGGCVTLERQIFSAIS